MIMQVKGSGLRHPRPQGYPVFLNVTSRTIFPLTKWIGGSGDEDGLAPSFLAMADSPLIGHAITPFSNCARPLYPKEK